MDIVIRITLLCSVFGAALSGCPNHWKSFAGTCYLIHTSSRQSWNDASHYCHRYESHLVHIDFEEENRFIIDKVRFHIKESDVGRRSGVWIGGTDSKHEGHWVWNEDDYPILEYTNWHPGQPDSGHADHDEDCMCMIGHHEYEWEDYRCSNEMYFVCEKIDANYTLPLVG